MSSFNYEYGTLSIEPSNISTHKRQSSNLYNSTSKLQDFFGVDDIEELKTNTPYNKRNSAPNACKLKSIFSPSNSNKKNKKQKQESKRIRSGLNKLRKEKKQTKCNLLRKLTNSKPIQTETLKIKTETNSKILWRPKLKTILNDSILLNELIKFMEMSYNSENILFLIEIIELNNIKNNEIINNKIIKIYKQFIEPYSEYQINLSYHCLINIMNKKNIFLKYEIENKKSMFNLCVEEIENLIITSVLNSFYSSSFFQLNANKSKYYKNDNHPKYFHNNYPSNDSDSSHSYSPYASLSTPAIKIETSISTESFFEFGA